MLIELSVSNFGIAEHVRWKPGAGLVVLTGETGAGKSLLVTALSFLLGERAQVEWLRSGAQRAEVSGIFAYPSVSQALPNDLGMVPGEELIVRRELVAAGRTRSWINDRPVTLTALRQVTSGLCDLHGQHQHQWLLDPEHHADYLDRFLSTEDRSHYARAFSQWQQTRTALGIFMADLSASLEQKAFWEYQVAELDRMDPQPGEYEQLEAKRRAFRQGANLAELYRVLEAELSVADNSVAPRLGHLIDRLAKEQDRNQVTEAWITALEAAKASVEEVAASVSRALSQEGQPSDSLEEIEARLHALYSLKKRFGGSMEHVLQEREKLSERLRSLADSEIRRRDLEQSTAQAWSEVERAATQLNDARTKATNGLLKALSGPLNDLGLGESALSVDIRQLAPEEWTEAGPSAVEFMLATNPGEDPKALARIASGGELSRIMLALKSVFPGADRVETLVFDEVDTGIGGETAVRVADLLSRLASGRQVIVISHLHQIASRGDVHFEVTKVRRNGRHVPDLRELSESERVTAIGRLIAGGRPTPEALAAARVLVASRSD